MMRQLGILIIVVIANLILSNHSAFGTSGGVTNVGALASGATEDTGSREWVELLRAGDLLIGRPAIKDIKLITVYAPGVDKSHLILREVKLPDGRSSLFFGAPNKLSRKTLRATIYMKHSSLNLVLLENVEGRWIERRPQAIPITENVRSETLQDVIVAFSVDKLGSYWVLEGHSQTLGQISSISQKQSASSLLGGGYMRGILPWAGAFLLLGIGWTLSRWTHSIERNRVQ